MCGQIRLNIIELLYVEVGEQWADVKLDYRCYIRLDWNWTKLGLTQVR